MSALRYYDLPFDQPKTPAREGLIDRICARLWSWAVERQKAASVQSQPITDPHLLRDIGMTDVDMTRN